MRPVLIYQMGKVGSTTISKTLTEHGYSNHQIHYLSEDKLKRIEDNYRADNKEPPEHCRSSRLVLNEGLLGQSIKIITLIRDPIARNISAFFQNISNYFDHEELFSVSTDTLVRKFINHYPHHIATDWFEREFKPNTNIDVLSFDLNKGNGYFRMTEHEKDVLLIKVEAPDSTKVDALNIFIPQLGLTSLKYYNIGSLKVYSSQYEAFKDTFKVPASYADKMYSAPIIRHLYSDNEIQDMKRKWQKN